MWPEMTVISTRLKNITEKHVILFMNLLILSR